MRRRPPRTIEEGGTRSASTPPRSRLRVLGVVFAHVLHEGAVSRAALWCLGAVRADWRVEWGRRGLPEASRRTRPLVGNQGTIQLTGLQSQKINIAVRSRFVRSSDELPWYSSACGCEAGRGGEEKRKGSSSRTSSRVRAPKGERPNRCSEPRGCRPERTPKPNEPRVHRTSS